MKAVYPGSFDPFTLGHLNILERATKIFDFITVVIAKNNQKKYMFTPEQRYNIALLSTAHLKNVCVVNYSGIVADFANDEKTDVIIRGIRGSTDLDHEIKLEQYNSKVCTAETIYLTPKTEYLNTSSTLVRMFIESKKLDYVSNHISQEALEYIKSLFSGGQIHCFPPQ